MKSSNLPISYYDKVTTKRAIIRGRLYTCRFAEKDIGKPYFSGSTFYSKSLEKLVYEEMTKDEREDIEENIESIFSFNWSHKGTEQQN